MVDLEFDRKGLEGYIRSEWKEVPPSLHWECIRCSWCCRQPWRVNLTWPEFDRIVALAGKKELPGFGREVDPETGLDHPFFVIEGKCPMLEEEGAVCTIYPDWPYTCATYPFLLMPDGRLMYHTGCAGIGKGDVIDIDSMKENIMRERKKAGMR